MENQKKKLRLDEFSVESFVTSTTLNSQTVLGGDPTNHCQGLTATDFGGGVSGNIAIDCGGGGGGEGNATCGGYTCPGGNGPNCPYGPPSPTCGGPPYCLPATQRPGDICV
jgi:hypothetical protein